MKLGRLVSLLVLGSALITARLTVASTAAQAEPKFSIDCQNLSAPEVSALASRELGLSLIYIPRDPQTRLNLDLKGLSRAEIEAALGRSGTVAVAPSETSQGPALSATRVSLQATSAKAGDVAQALRRLSRERFLFVPKDSAQAVSLDCKQITFSQLADILASFGETRFQSSGD
jgi:hypothetical protein